MKAVRSMPALAQLSTAHLNQKQRVAAHTTNLHRSHSMLATSNPQAQLQKLIRSVPFVALPGLGSQLARSYSRYEVSAAGALGSSRASPEPSPYHATEESSLLPPLPAPPSYTYALSVAVLCATLSSFQVGLNSGLLNVPETVIRASLALSVNEWSVIVSIFCIGGLVGSVMGGRLADTIGRKNLLTSVNVLFIGGALLQSLATSYWMLLAGRLVIGCGCGCATVSVPMYVGEIAPAALRGSLGTMNQFAIVIGILVANLLGRVLGGAQPATADGGGGGEEAQQWRYLLGVVVVPSLLQLVLSSALLESPLWLIQQNSHTSVVDAEAVLTKLRGADYDDLDFELELLSAVRDDSLAAQSADDSTGGGSLWATLSSRPVRRSLWIGLMLQLFQQFSGINAVFYYSTAFFASAHVGDPWLASVLCSAVNVVATGLAIPMMDRAGRRTLLVLSALGMMVSCVGLTAALKLSSIAADSASSAAAAHSAASHHHSSAPPSTDASSSSSSYLLSSLSVFGVLAYVTCFEVGLGPIPWLMGAELYPAHARALGMSLAAVVNWGSNFLISLSFPHMSARLHEWTFLPFTAALLACTAFVWAAVPETRGKTLEEIQAELGGAKVRERGEGGRMGGGGGGFEEEDGEGYESESSAGSWGGSGGVGVVDIEYADDASSEASPSPVSLTPVGGTRGVWKGGAGGGHGRVSSHTDLRAVSR